MAKREEQSMRMRPSWSSGMKPKVGSSSGRVTVRSSFSASAMGAQ